MDKEFLYGNEISVNFCHATDSDFIVSPFKKSKGFISSNDASGTSSSSRDSSASPSRDIDEESNFSTRKKFDFPPPPVLDSQTIPSLLKNRISLKEFQPQNYTKNSSLFPAPPNMELFKDSKNFQLDWNFNKILNQSNGKSRDVSAFSPFKKEADSRIKLPQKTIGRVTPFLMHECDKSGRSPLSDPGVIRNSSCKIDSTSNYLFNRGYQNSVQNVSSSFEIQHVNEPYFYSPTWNGAAAISDSALSISRSNTLSSFESSFVELHVSNLDPTYEINELKRILLSVFREHVMVLHISMTLQPDGSPKATVKVPSLQDAQFAISRLHRKKIGHKRILISHVSSNKIPPFSILKSETIALLSDIPNKSLPLIKFRELYEKRYHRPIAVSELYKMRDAVTIQGDSGSRTVYLNAEYCNTPSLPESEDSQECNTIERPYCEVHFHVSASQGWAEQYNICPLPLVHISLKILSTAVHRLLDSHQGSLPLISFCDCYEAEIGPLPIVGSVVASREDTFEVSLGANQITVSKGPKGVPLEHLIACIAGVEVAKSILCIKKVQWLENKLDTQGSQNFNPALMGQLTLFGREVMDLLKSQPQCLVQFNKFIPTYHHHFGRQCRVADYGFTKLIDLLEAIPHIVQVLGEGQNRQVTLTHRTQVRRFAAELLRILKSRASKQITITEFAQAYEQVIEKPFEITNYGVCEIEDMLNEVSENVVVTSSSGSETLISIPKREQTLEEIERTKLFAEEVVELMKHKTNCSMAFNKFIPSYHHHFGKQCRVADYGFTKLIELFEVIPEVLEVKGTGEDKILQLVEKEKHKILTERLVSVLKSHPNEMVDITQLCDAFIVVHGYALRPSDFGFKNLEELLEKLNTVFKVIVCSGKTYVCLINHEFLNQISLNVRKLLMEQTDGKMSIKDVCALYQIRFLPKIDITPYISDLTGEIQITNGFLQLTPSHMVARAIIKLIQENGAQVLLSSLGNLFHQKYGVPLNISDCGFQSMSAMLEHYCDYFVLRGKRQKRLVCLNLDVTGYLFSSETSHPLLPVKEETNDIDILNEPVPSGIPTPTLEPHVRDKLEDLMGFETPPSYDLCYINSSTFESSKERSAMESISKSLRLHSSTGKFLDYQNSQTTSSICPGVSSEISSHSPSTYSESEMPRDSATPTTPKLELKLNFPKSNIIANTNHNGFEHFISKSSISMCSVNSQSCEVTTKYKNHSLETKDDVLSTKSTPTSEVKQSRRCRIAAQFSSPIDD